LFRGGGSKRVGALFFALVMVLSLVSASGAALFPARALAVTAPTNQADCQALGGTWTNNDHVHNLCTLPLVTNLSLEQQVQSYVYYYTLGNCLANGFLNDGGLFTGGIHHRISVADVTSGQWFAGSNEFGGSYLDGVSGIKTTPDGSGQAGTQIDCGQPALVNGALQLWNNWAPDEALCAFGYVRASGPAARCTNAQGGTDEFQTGSNVESAFKTAVNTRIYGGKAPTLSDAAKYLLYLKAFQKACVPNATASPTPPTGNTSKDYAVRVVTGDGKAATAAMVYYTDYRNLDKTAPIYLYPDIYLSPSGAKQTCGGLVAAINGKDGKSNGLADAYVSQLRRTGDTNVTGSAAGQGCPAGATTDSNGNPCLTTSGAAPTCGDAVQGIGWIVCPVFNFVGGLNDMMWGFMSALLTVSPVQQNQTDSSGAVQMDSSGNPVPSPTYRVWGAFRSIANVVLAIAFLFMIFSQLTGAGISNYGMKKLLPRWVVAAIFINISFPVMQVVVDAANIVGSSLYGLIGNLAQFDPTTVSWEKLGGLIAGSTALQLGAAVGISAAVIAPGAVFAMVLPVLIAGAFGFLAALVVLMMRQALIPILIAVAPVAIAFYLIPNTKPWFDKWKNLLVSMLMLFPIAGLVFGGAKLAAAVISGEKSWWSTLLALVVLSVPLFTLPFLARQTGPMLGKIGGAFKGVSTRAQSLGRKATDPMRKLSLAQAQSKVPLWGAIARHRQRTGLRANAYEAQHQAEFNREVATHADTWAGSVAGADAQAFIRGAGAKAQAEELKVAQIPLEQELAAVRAGRHATFGGTDVDAFLEHRATDTSRSATESEAAMHKAAALGRDGVVRRLSRNPAVDQQAMQRAIATNAGSLLGKAPDIVKGNDAAFGTVTGSALSKFSSGTATAHMAHLQDLHAKATAPSATAADLAALDKAAASFNSAVEDITLDNHLQGEFDRDTGLQILHGVASSSAGFQAYASSHLSGLAAIQGDGKIR
jgi:hypothetical protein